MIFRIGPGSKGYNALGEYLDMDCVVSIPASTTLFQGQPIWYDQTKIPASPPTGSTIADSCVLGPSANAVRLYGIYQGPNVVNTSSTVALAQNILVRKLGYGVVLGQVTASGTGSSAINVGSNLIAATNTAGLYANYAGTAAIGVEVGYALATGAVTTPGSQLMAGTTAATLILNAYIQVL